MQDWQFPDGFDETAENDFLGFVYLITNERTGRGYVGRKVFKYKVRGKMRPNNWRKYHGSCKPLLEEIEREGTDHFRREVLSLHMTKAALGYAETAEQFGRDVLNAKLPDGSRAYYNGNIMSRWFVTTKMSDDAKAKIAASKRGKPRPKHVLEALRKSRLGRTPHNKGLTLPNEQKDKIRATRIANRSGMRLTEDQVREIRSSSEALAVLAKRLGVGESSISRVRNRFTYSWVTD